MEKTTKSIGISTLITLMIVSIVTIGPNFFIGSNYYCESRPELGLVQCDSFSKYVADNGKCIRNDNTNLICREGWSLVIDDRVLPEEENNDIIPKTSSTARKYKCTNLGCVGVD